MKKPFSKILLIADYIIAISLIFGYMICVAINGAYASNFINELVDLGYDASSVVVPQILNLDGFTILLGAWVGQLCVSSGAYYSMAKADHQVQIPATLIKELPKDIRDNVDMDNLITTALTMSQ